MAIIKNARISPKRFDSWPTSAQTYDLTMYSASTQIGPFELALYEPNQSLLVNFDGQIIEFLSSGSTGTTSFTGDYLPLSGGTMTGDILMDDDVDIWMSSATTLEGRINWGGSQYIGYYEPNSNVVIQTTGVQVAANSPVVSGTYSGVFCANASSVSSNYSTIVGGTGNNVLAGSVYSSIIGGQNNTISATTGFNSFFAGSKSCVDYGQQNASICSTSSSFDSTAVQNSIISSTGSYISGGTGDSSIIGCNNVVIKGISGFYYTTSSFAASSYNSLIGDSDYTTLLSTTSSEISFSNYSSILGGNTNKILSGVSESAIIGGYNNSISGLTSVYSTIQGGSNNIIDGSPSSMIAASAGCVLSGRTQSAIIAANAVTATTDYTLYTDNITISTLLQMQPYSSALPAAADGKIIYSANTGLMVCVGTTWKLITAV